MKKTISTLTITFENKLDPKTEDRLHERIIDVIEDSGGIVLSLTIE